MLLKEVLDIPTTLGAEQFVLRLTEGVSDEQAARTLEQYVVTPQIARNLDTALGLIQGALGVEVGADGSVAQRAHQRGRAVYLHGSFGSGKSHFMAVLHLLLGGNALALNRPELAPVVAKYRAWLGTKKLLLVPFHMLGAETVNEQVFRGYCRLVERRHPGTKPPALFDADRLIADAEHMRRTIGDEAFFKMLGQDAGDEGWGDLATGWDPGRYCAALAGPAGSTERRELGSVLADRVFPSAARNLGTVPFDEGLELVTAHAKALGYDGIVLFLDELILWLATKVATPGFLQQEINKVVCLVEAQRMDRPIPLVAFIARQRDLRELIGNDSFGAQQLAIDDQLAYHEGRFRTVELSTTDLPEIASRRLLKPKSPAAEGQIQASFDAFAALLRGGQGAMLKDALLGERYTLEDFRKVYPFSPALVDTLVAAASMLQRDRTALRAMLQLLVEQREHLELGEIIPVGDLYDVIKRGNDAITPAFEAKFEAAQRFFDRSLVPLLEREHRITRQQVEDLPWIDERRKKWRADERILKTVLLSNLVPSVTALQHLTPQRIAALNHGSIVSFIPGGEAQVVAGKLRAWSAEVTELQLAGDATNPQVTLALHGVDIEGVLRNAASHDNHGNRVALLKEIVLGELGIQGGELEDHFTFTWRGTKRDARVLFRNLGGLHVGAFENESEDNWQVIVDHPIDEHEGGPRMDDERVRQARERFSSTQTLLWRPAMLNQQARNELGRLVRLERILKSDQSFEGAASHLSAEDRAQAKPLLEGQRRVLREKVVGTLMAAYGLSNEPRNKAGLDGGVVVGDVFVSLDPSFTPRPPAAGRFRDGLERLLHQALEHRYPGAPRWEKSFGRADLGRALELALKAASRHPHRVDLDTQQSRLMRDFAVPLELGRCATAFELGNFWLNHFNSLAARSGESAVIVRDLRDWTDEPEPRGLPREVQDLLAIVYAAQGERAFYRNGAPMREEEIRVGGLQASDELRRIPLPSEEAWRGALERAGAIFGVTNPDLFCNGPNASSLAKSVRDLVSAHRRLVQTLRDKLRQVTPLQLQPSSKRMKDADAVLDLFERLDVDSPKELIERLADQRLDGEVTPQSIGTSWRQAQVVIDAIERMNWRLVDGLERLRGDGARGAAAQAALRRLHEALDAHQLAVPLPEVLREVEARATELIVESGGSPPPPSPPPLTPGPEPTPARPPQPGSRSAVLRSRADLGELSRRLGDELDQGDVEIDVQWTVRGGRA